MARQDILYALYSKKKSPLEFNFDRLTAPPLLSLLSVYDIAELNKIAKSVKLSGKINEKYKLIDNIMTRRGFTKLHAGTNRVVYKFIEDQRFVVKIAIDRVGLGDNPAEFKNQFLLKPFVTKIFEVSPCGTVAITERVDPIMSREEFLSVADDVFSLITKFFVGKYVLEDFGSHYFMNWGIRKGYGLVLLDFPYVYELDGNKLYCNASIIPGRKDVVCGGQLDYDDGFNNLICTKCGRHYQARNLKKAEENKLIIIGGNQTMRVQIMVGNKIILDSGKTKIAKVIDPEPDTESVKNIEETVVTKVESRIDTTVPKKVSDKPSDAIFEKVSKKETIVEEQKNTDSIVEENDSNLEDVSIVVGDIVEEQKNTDSIEQELDSVLMDNDEDEYDDYEDYDQYLSNRQRTNIRSSKKSRKGNTDYSDF